jgi:LCP family protein required for cell wall assembly
MDNFRKFNGNKRKRPAAIDGFKPMSSRTPRPGMVGRNQAYRPEPQSKTLGNFKTTEGFHPARQSTIQSTRAVGRNPHRTPDGSIALDMPVAAPPAKRHGHKARNWKKTILKSFAGVALVLVLAGGFLFAKGYLNLHKVFRGGAEGAAALQENVDPSKLKGEGDGRVNILLVGKDAAAGLTDTIIIASINPIQKEAALLSIPRDLYVKTGTGGYTKINAVYANARNQVLNGRKTDDQAKRADDAGFEALENVIESKIGIPIHYHVMVDFEGFKQAIDTVGGVDINVTDELAVQEQMNIEGRWYNLNVQPGQQHFDGFRALAFARSRHTSARGDFSRSERQRAVLVALKSKVFSAGTYANPLKISSLMSNFGNHVQTNLAVNEISRLYDIGKDIDGSKVASVGLADPPNNYLVTDNIDGISIVRPRAGLDNYKEIQNFIRNKLKDGFLADENATIAVLNGTNVAGLAGRTAEELKSYGYNVSQIADAPTKGYTSTIIVDLRNGQKKYTKAYLEKRFGTSVVSSLPDSNINPGTADFVIILGQNEPGRLQQ